MYEVLDGQSVSDWRTGDLGPLLQVLEQMRGRLDPSPSVDTTPCAEAFTPLLGTWQALAGAPGDAPTAGTVEHVRSRPLPLEVPVQVLADLESRWLPVLTSGSSGLDRA